MARKSKEPSKKELRKVLMESLFDPRNDKGPLKIIYDMKNPGYFENRAIELINEAQVSIHSVIPFSLDVYHDRLAKAVTLLALARLLRGK